MNFKLYSLSLKNGQVSGTLHLRRLIDELEYEVDQPISFSCSPTTFTIESAYQLIDEPSNEPHLHQYITAPDRSIKVYDLSSNTEAHAVCIEPMYND